MPSVTTYSYADDSMPICGPITFQIAGFFGSHGKHDSAALFGPLHDLQHMLAQRIQVGHGNHHRLILLQRGDLVSLAQDRR